MIVVSMGSPTVEVDVMQVAFNAYRVTFSPPSEVGGGGSGLSAGGGRGSFGRAASVPGDSAGSGEGAASKVGRLSD